MPLIDSANYQFCQGGSQKTCFFPQTCTIGQIVAKKRKSLLRIS
jgi:hypothetical protein